MTYYLVVVALLLHFNNNYYDSYTNTIVPVVNNSIVKSFTPFGVAHCTLAAAWSVAWTVAWSVAQSANAESLSYMCTPNQVRL